MQYLLTQEEFDSIHILEKEARRSLERLPTVKELQKFCTMVADNLPVKSGWYKGKVWGCILTKKSPLDDSSEDWYCDDCPAKDICPHPGKHWSK